MNFIPNSNEIDKFSKKIAFFDKIALEAGNKCCYLARQTQFLSFHLKVFFSFFSSFAINKHWKLDMTDFEKNHVLYQWGNEYQSNFCYSN